MSDLIRTIEDDEEPSDLSEESASEEEFQPTRKRIKAAKSGGMDPTFSFQQHANDIWTTKLTSIVSKPKKKQPAKRTTLNEKITKHQKPNVVPEVKDDSAESSESEEEEDDVDMKSESDELLSDDSLSAAGPKSKKKLKGQNGKEKGKKSKVRDEEDDDDDIDLSEDELVSDQLRVKEKLGKKKKAGKGKNGRKKEDSEEEEEDDEAKLEQDGDFEFETDMTFQQMNLSRPLLKSVSSLGFVHPTPIQAAAIPIALAGRDICGCAATGTGKTAAYMLPVLERLLYKPRAQAVTRVLCLVPTRELGVQVYTVTKQLASFSSEIQVAIAVGGLDVAAQEAVLRQNPDIVIATPGRLIDHLGNTPSFSLDAIEILILDEADRMLDEWFAEQLKQIVKQCSPRRQTLLFSATMTDRVKDLATVSLKNPSKIFVDSNRQVAFNLRQEFVKIRNETDREAILCSLVVRTFHSRTMVFVPTKKTAHRLHILLGLMNIRIGELHGDLSQDERLASLKKFQNSEVDVLIVTDVAARGLDIPGVLSVLNYSMPPTVMQYIHRCGRTARAGRSGVAVSLVGEKDRRLMKQVVKAATLPVKARIIPPDIIGKYRDRLKAMEPDIEAVVTEEQAEKLLAKAEIQANKALKLLAAKKEKKKKKKKNAQNGGEDGKRIWFQSHKERMTEKERLKGGRASADDRKAMSEALEDKKLRKLTEFQARAAKRKRKPNKNIGAAPSAFADRETFSGGKKQKRKSHFADELTNTKKARQFRHTSKAPQNKNKSNPGNKSANGQNKSDRKFKIKVKGKNFKRK